VKKFILVTFLSLCFLADNAGAMTIEEAASGEHRSENDIARNVHRNPVETLTFFGIEKNMAVLEIWPGSRGWYTEILAPFLKESGTYYAANYDGSTGLSYFEKGAKKFRTKIDSSPKIYGDVILKTLMPPTELTPAPAESLDLVLTFRNIHNWVNNGIEEAILASAFTMLKRNGVLGLVAHRTKNSALGRDSAQSGYLTEKQVIALVEKVGFRLSEKSEINGNPKDTADHPKGVWTLPPVLRLGDEDREKYLEIGESDRMTLKFVKP